jgi:hypothetical protein
MHLGPAVKHASRAAEQIRNASVSQYRQMLSHSGHVVGVYNTSTEAEGVSDTVKRLSADSTA